MARIRSIKPEFWTSEQIAECSPNARLLFIGLWNFCDDYGVHPASCARLKMQIFPADGIGVADVKSMVAELLSAGLIIQYEVESSSYWMVTGWEKHQKIDSPTGRHPLPDGSIGRKIRRSFADNSANEGRSVDEHSPQEKEKEKEKEKEESSLSSSPTQTNCPQSQIVDLYHRYLPANPRIKVWDGARATSLKTRWCEDPKRQSLEYWERFFKHCAASEFLTGRTEGHGGRPFLPGLEWMVKASNFAKIIENRYHERKQ